MSLKKLLGLDSFSLSETEIMKKLEEAFKNNREEVIFSSSNKKVIVKLSKISPLGLMNDHRDYYAQ